MLIRLFLGLVWALLTLPAFSQAQPECYIYRGKTITKTSFDQLYASHGKYLYSDGSKTYWLYRSWTEANIGPETRSTYMDRIGAGGPSRQSGNIVNVELKKLSISSKIGDAGAVDGKVLSVIPGGALLECGEATFKLHGQLPKNLTDGADLDLVALRTGTYQYTTTQGSKATVPDLQVISKASADEFKAFLATGAVLMEIKQEAIKCAKCGGKGTIEDRKKLGGSKCPSCNGTGKAGTTSKEVEIQP